MTIIFSYTRADAIADGVLKDVSEMAAEAGIRFPAACTGTLWAELVAPSEFARSIGNSEEGRLWDILWMFVMATKGMIPHKNYREGLGEALEYETLFVMGEEFEPVSRAIKAVCGPGDNAEPVITFMLPHED